ncbi:hypothetical protein BFP72_09130 [Reichenbachiella sp. 5M10]|uniref:hypothetical protein n=1 Tax=Reichenbachiella sp. 5M10 TaxID=1889772 RepID=UPI000C14964C|nr:hypothetical protein [Reichenbachiella sp. 5M10]PIB35541.1 hypothetical protein BFP72_09130 [Reichenbachiella sp. 5M10]
MKTNYTRRVALSLALVCVTSQWIIAQQDTTNVHTVIQSKRSVAGGVAVNLFSLLGNYSTFMLSGQVRINEQWSMEVGAGPVLDSEVWARNNFFNDGLFGVLFVPSALFYEEPELEQKQGYAVSGETKYYFLSGNHQPFLGVGYSYLNSKYDYSYILRIEEGGSRYYKNVDQEYQAIVHTVYFMLGYRLTFAEDKLFIEAGVNFRRKFKDISPNIEAQSGMVVSGTGLHDNFDNYPLPISFDLKIGVMIFR